MIPWSPSPLHISDFTRFQLDTKPKNQTDDVTTKKEKKKCLKIPKEREAIGGERRMIMMSSSVFDEIKERGINGWLALQVSEWYMGCSEQGRAMDRVTVPAHDFVSWEVNG